MAQDLTRPGGSALFNSDQRVDTDDINAIGTMAEASLWDGLVARFTDGINGFFGDDCIPVKEAGDLDYSVATGMGIVDVPSLGGVAPVRSPKYTPIYVDTIQNGSANTHDPTNARKDILTLKPSSVDDTDDTLQIFDGVSGFTPTLLKTRRRRNFTLNYIAGTPSGSPAAPATPAGELRIALIDVPAISGPIVVSDERVEIGIVTDAIANDSVTAAKLEKPTTWFRVTAITAEASNKRDIEFSHEDLAGLVQSHVQRFIVEVYTEPGIVNSSLWTADADSAGSTQISNAGAAAGRVIGETDGSGVFAVTIEDQSAIAVASAWVHIQPVSTNGTPVRPGEASIIEVTFT